jgi:protocatechuate 3,4-dioxygenase, alpha subunit
MKLLPTASQTVGPYLHIGLAWLTIDRLVPADSPDKHVTISGQVLDGDGQPVTDALVEIWQANAAGQYGHPDFLGFGRVPTNADGRFEFEMVKPGLVADPEGGQQAPHLLVSVFMRGLLKRLVTRIYFPDEPRNTDDFVLRQVPAERRNTLVARQLAPGKLQWNVVLQGEGETVFFDC